MTSKVMRINSASYDSRTGMESDVTFYTKEGTILSAENLIEAYFTLIEAYSTLQDLNRVTV
jgi:hypothetical protein